MALIGLIHNLSVLVALSVVSGFFDKRFPRDTLKGKIIQGVIFGSVAVLGMMQPFIFSPGIIFDGRSVVISLCTLFFGFISGFITIGMAILFRIYQSGGGVITGTFVIISSFLIGLIFHKKNNTINKPKNLKYLFYFGLAVHITMILLMLTLPYKTAINVISTMGIPIIIFYPLATVLIGKILNDQEVYGRAIETLKKSETKFRNYIHNAPYAIFVSDDKGKILEVNKEATELTYYTKEELLSKTLKEFSFFRDSEAGRNRMQYSFEKTGEYIFINRYNEKRHIYIKPVKLDDKNYISFVSDITDKKIAEKALIESEMNYRTLADSGTALIWTSGKDKLCNYFNKPWLEFTGRKLEEEIGNGWVEGVHPDDLIKCVEIYEKSFNKRKKFSMEYRIKHNSGNYRWIVDEGSPRFDSQGDFLGYIGYCLDITDRKMAERKIAESLQEKNLLLKEIHHRVKNNLQIISSLINLQSNLIDDEKIINVFRNSQSRIRTMALIHELIYGTENFVYLNIPEYLSKLIESIRVTYSVHSEQVEINLEADKLNLGMDLILPVGLIINELLTNSLKHSFPNGRNGIINISLKNTGRKNFSIILSDNGIGFPPDFEMKSKNTLGVFLVKTLVKQLNGEIDFITQSEGVKIVINFKSESNSITTSNNPV